MNMIKVAVWAVVASAWCSIAAGAQTRSPGDDELRKVGASLNAYFEARAKESRVDEARAELLASFTKVRAQFAGWDPLRTSSDLGRALELASTSRKTQARDGSVESWTVRVGSFADRGLEIVFRLPRDYDATRRYPLVLSLPDYDETPADHLRLHWSSPALRDGAIVVSPAMPTARTEWTRVAVNGRPGGLCHALTALRVASERLAVDADRIYIVGRGRGVPAALACGNTTPQRFAGVIGRAGDADELGPDNFGALPVLLVGGGARANEFHAAALELGFDHCTTRANASEEELWSWMQEHPRRRAPNVVTVQPGDPFPTRAYWLRIAPSASDARATAELDRATNSVRITANGVSGVTLYLNDGLLDLDRPLAVICNGVESSRQVERRLALALELLHDGTSDPTCVYVARVDLDLSGRASTTVARPSATEEAEFQPIFAAAGDDPGKLWELYVVSKASLRDALAARVLRKLVRVAPDHEQARAELGHVRSGERWFASNEALERFVRGQDPAVAAARGFVQHRSAWVHAEERVLFGKGQHKDHESGLWLSVDERDRLAKGWARQDLEWIAPKDVAHVDADQWLVDGEWVDLATANQRHSAIDAPWRIPTREVQLTTTVERDVALRAVPHMERAIEDLRRVFGMEPLLPLGVVLLRDEEQYDRFAFGDPDGRRGATHAGRLHSIHYGFVAESWLPPREGRFEFRGAGVGYWDVLVPNGDLYGVHSARLACALSFVEALDPSPKAVRDASANGPKPGYYDAYQAEKRLPAWLRFGAAVYAERYFRDPSVPADGDAWWARKWSLDNLRNAGGLDPLAQVFEFRLDPDQRDASRKLLLEAGLIVAFLVDGECAPANEALVAVQRALVAGRVSPKLFTTLAASVTTHEAELRKFAGL